MQKIIQKLVKKHKNDADLGAAVRSLVVNFGEDLIELRKQRFEMCRDKEVEVINKIEKTLGI